MSRDLEIPKQLAKRDSLQPHDPIDLFKAVAMDIGKEVACHIEIMYPEAVKAASSTFLLSVRNSTYNNIMAAIDVEGYEATVSRLDFNKRFRRYIRAQYRKLRADEKLSESVGVDPLEEK
jgi:hypothetical protein